MRTSISPIFICPSCRAPLTLRPHATGAACARCDHRVADPDGVLDFVTDPAREAERAYYQQEYRSDERADRPPGRPAEASLEDLALLWSHPAKPINRELRRALGSLRCRRVLLVGNGGSPKELDFLRDGPKLLVFTDLAPAGVRCVRDMYDLSGQEDRLVFAAVDALDLPLLDESVDVVYGNAIVHHLPDRARFLTQVVRVLAPGGHAVFADNTHSPMWQAVKRTLLLPLLRWSHRRYPRSPEDVRETMQGGFRIRDVEDEIRGLGAEPFVKRLNLLWYVWRRATLVLLPPRFRALGDNVAIARALTTADRWLARIPAIREQQIAAVWGLRKPDPATPAPPASY